MPLWRFYSPSWSVGRAATQVSRALPVTKDIAFNKTLIKLQLNANVCIALCPESLKYSKKNTAILLIMTLLFKFIKKKVHPDSCFDSIAVSPGEPAAAFTHINRKWKKPNQSRWGDETFSLIIWEFINESSVRTGKPKCVKKIKIRPRPRSSKVCTVSMKKEVKQVVRATCDWMKQRRTRGRIKR